LIYIIKNFGDVRYGERADFWESWKEFEELEKRDLTRMMTVSREDFIKVGLSVKNEGYKSSRLN